MCNIVAIETSNGVTEMTNTKISFRDAQKMARTVCGDVSPALLWNTLTTRVRKGQDITDFTTMALVASVVGEKRAPEFVATIQKIWAPKAAA
jgi:hypothetical protein